MLENFFKIGKNWKTKLLKKNFATENFKKMLKTYFRKKNFKKNIDKNFEQNENFIIYTIIYIYVYYCEISKKSFLKIKKKF